MKSEATRCEHCKEPVEVIRLGSSAPAVCAACAPTHPPIPVLTSGTLPENWQP